MNHGNVIAFTRDPGPLAIVGLRGHSIAALRAEAHSLGLTGAWIVADLSLGAWRGHQVAAEFCDQLGIELPKRSRPARAPGQDLSEFPYADIVGEFIDTEALGDSATGSALEHAELIRSSIEATQRYTFVVLAPMFGAPWEEENLLFIRFLSQALHPTQSNVIVACTGQQLPEIPRDWRVSWRSAVIAGDRAGHTEAPTPLPRLVPGIVTARMLEMIGDAGAAEPLETLGNGHFLVPPEFRQDPATVDRLLYEQFAERLQSIGWLESYGAYHGRPVTLEPWALYIEGMQRFAEGGSGIMLRLLECAIGGARTAVERGIFQSHAQGLRIALQRFAEAAAIDDPPMAMPPRLRGFLLQSKGWGLVMTGAHAAADQYFEQARAVLEPLGDGAREYLYLLNISALARLRLGKPDEAMGFEQAIEEKIALLDRPDRRLEYVNTINIARLHRRAERLDDARDYYRKAFATTLGARSESDQVFTSVINARLASSAGDHDAASTHWARAALHWAASEMPEAISLRAATAILGSRPSRRDNIPEAIAEVLEQSLRAAAQRVLAGDVWEQIEHTLLADEGDRGIVRAARLASTPTGGTATAEGAELPGNDLRGAMVGGVGLFATSRAFPRQLTGIHSRSLRGLLWAMAEVLAPQPFLEGARSIVVDDQLGTEIPATPPELLGAAIRLNADSVWIGDGVIRTGEQNHEPLQQQMRVAPGLGVDCYGAHDNRILVLFKRYLAPVYLGLLESSVFRLACAASPVQDIIQQLAANTEPADTLALIRDMEQRRILQLYFDTEQYNCLPALRNQPAASIAPH